MVPLRLAGMELIALLAGGPQCCASDLCFWLNLPENTAEFWLLLSSPCISWRFFSLFPHSAPTASKGEQEAGSAHSLDRRPGHPDYKIQTTNLALSGAPVPCTRQTHPRKMFQFKPGLHTCVTRWGQQVWVARLSYNIPTHAQVLLPAGKRENFPGGAVSGWLPAKEQRHSYHSSDKRHEKKAASSLSGQLSALVQSHFPERFKRKKGIKKVSEDSLFFCNPELSS